MCLLRTCLRLPLVGETQILTQVASYAKVRSLILVVLLFLLSVGGVLVTTQVWASTAIKQTQQEPLQLVEQGKLYQFKK